MCVCVRERFRREVGRGERERRGEEREIHSLLLLPFQMRQATAKQVASVQKQQQDVGYKTKVVGGVVHRVPIKGVRCHPYWSYWNDWLLSLSLSLSPSLSLLSLSSASLSTQLTDGTENGDGKVHGGGEDGAAGGAAGAGIPDGYRRKTRGFPRIFKAGWGIKLGAVVSRIIRQTITVHYNFIFSPWFCFNVSNRWRTGREDSLC